QGKRPEGWVSRRLFPKCRPGGWSHSQRPEFLLPLRASAGGPFTGRVLDRYGLTKVARTGWNAGRMTRLWPNRSGLQPVRWGAPRPRYVRHQAGEVETS